jgi:hypothetical protein
MAMTMPIGLPVGPSGFGHARRMVLNRMLLVVKAARREKLL